MICDILAGERGPSCKKMRRIIPQLKVFCVGFIKKQDPAEDEETDTDPAGQGTGTQQQNGRKDFSLTSAIHISFAGLVTEARGISRTAVLTALIENNFIQFLYQNGVFRGHELKPETTKRNHLDEK